jgi:hypothetical protein
MLKLGTFSAFPDRRIGLDGLPPHTYPLNSGAFASY